MNSAYLDSSVLVSFYIPEPDSERIEAALIDLDRRLICEMTYIEVTSALMRKVRERILTVANAKQVLAVLQEHTAEGYFEKISLTETHWQFAAELLLGAGAAVPLRSLDAIHLAVAAVEKVSFITIDKHLLLAAGSAGVPVRHILR